MSDDVAMAAKCLVYLEAIFNIASEASEAYVHLFAFIVVKHPADVVGGASLPPAADSA